MIVLCVEKKMVKYKRRDFCEVPGPIVWEIKK